MTLRLRLSTSTSGLSISRVGARKGEARSGPSPGTQRPGRIPFQPTLSGPPVMNRCGWENAHDSFGASWGLSRSSGSQRRGVLVARTYLPNGNPQPRPKFTYKLAWFRRLIVRANSPVTAGRQSYWRLQHGARVDRWVRGEDNASDYAPAWIRLELERSAQTLAGRLTSPILSPAAD
jgi:hypothetical protein